MLRFRFDPIWVIDDEDDVGHAAHEAGYSAEAKVRSPFEGMWVGDIDPHPLSLLDNYDDHWLSLFTSEDDDSKSWGTEVARRNLPTSTRISLPEWDRHGNMQEDGSLVWEPLGEGRKPDPIDAVGLRWVRPFDGHWWKTPGPVPEGTKIGSIFGYHLTKGDGSVRLALDYYYAEGKWIIQFDGNGPNGLCTGELVEMDGKKAIKWEATDKVPEGDPLSIWVWGPLPGEGLPKSGGLCGGPATASGLKDHLPRGVVSKTLRVVGKWSLRLCGQPATAGSASDSV